MLASALLSLRQKVSEFIYDQNSAFIPPVRSRKSFHSSSKKCYSKPASSGNSLGKSLSSSITISISSDRSYSKPASSGNSLGKSHSSSISKSHSSKPISGLSSPKAISSRPKSSSSESRTLSSSNKSSLIPVFLSIFIPALFQW
uniref:Uncharacterized protein n=1 Tax=Ditylenchus dipsaci TaxID=166011 RepID=A0A915DS05_9BILA